MSASEDRSVRNPLAARVGAFDDLIIARVVAILVLAVLLILFRSGSNAEVLSAVLVVVAVIQPMVAAIWSHRPVYMQAQWISDIAAFAAVVLLAADYYMVASMVLVGVTSVHAIHATTRRYVWGVAIAVSTMAVCGAIQQVASWPQTVAIAFVVAVGTGVLGYRTRTLVAEVQDDLLVAVTEAGGVVHLTEMDGRFADILGDASELVGWDSETWAKADHKALIHPDDLDDFWVDHATVEEGQFLDRVARFRRPDGRWTWIRDRSRVVLHAGRPHLRGFWTDVSAEYDDLERVLAEASTDELTGLANRRFLIAELGRRQGGPGHGLVLIDLNRFKDVNDTLGHDAGDELLRIVGDRLASCLRPGDVLARLGGDEFALVVDSSGDNVSVTSLTDGYAAAIEPPIEISGVAVTITISAGIASSADGDASASTMLRHADIAMYAAKRADVSWWQFDAEMGADSDRRATLTAGLAEALEIGELALHFQPIIDIIDGEVVGLEGLARWDHPLFGMLAPGSFLDVALMSQMSGRFTQVMIEQGVDAIRQLTDLGHPMRVAVNIPIRVLEDEAFSPWVRRVCDEKRIDPGLLVFEVAEVDLHDSTTMARAIDRLDAVGVIVSIDDFGAGNATFERLRWRHVAQLKLDRSVVEGAEAHVRERTILHSILTLAEELGYEVVAEGVESQAQLELLRELGCRFAQGFHLAVPAPFSEVLELIERDGGVFGRAAVVT